jgi:hypothetical protein
VAEDVVTDVKQQSAWADLLAMLNDGEPEPELVVVTEAWTASNGLLTGMLKKDRKRIIQRYTSMRKLC